jgi:hypothetical protein
MARTKSIETYPPAFARVIEEAVLREIRLPMPTPKDAERLRGKLYAYFGAIHEAAKPIEALPEIKQLSHMARRVQLRIDGSVLIGRPQDQDPDAQLILQNLGSGHSMLSPVQGIPSAPTSTESWAMAAQSRAVSEPLPSEFLRGLAKGVKP